MRYAIAATASLLLAAAPAKATQGLVCHPAAAKLPRISLVIGAGGIAGASLDEKGGWISTMARDPQLILAQAWIDREQVMADIVSPGWHRVAELRARFDRPDPRKPRTARGTLRLRDRTIPVRCVED
jgi:hypothetical protein